MLETFPDDSEVLKCGVEAAIGRGAFKKASRLAGKLLAADPINPEVRLMLIDAHLAHARKVAKQQKYAIAFKECELAASYDRPGLTRGTIQMFQGLLFMATGDEAGGLQLIEEGQKQSSNPVLAHFSVRMEAGLLNLSPMLQKLFTGKLKKEVTTSLDKEVILQLLENIAICNGDMHFELEKFRSTLIPCLKKGARLAFSLDEFKRICQIFNLRCFYDLL
jgi:hypothetical protein